MSQSFVLMAMMTACLVAPANADESIDSLIGQLGEPNQEVQDRIIEHGEQAIGPLVAVLSDESNGNLKRGQAAEILGRIKCRKVVAPLRSVLADQDKFVSVMAVHALGELGVMAKSSLPDLVRMLTEVAEGDNSLRRKELIRAVGILGAGNADAIEAIAQCMKKRRDLHAAEALTLMGTAGIEKLVDLAVSYSSDSRAYRERRYGEAYARLTSGQPLPNEGVDVFRRHILKGGHNQTVGALAMGSVGAPALPVARQLLDSGDADVRAAVADALARMNSHARFLRKYKEKDAPDPVSAKDFFPILKGMCRRTDGTVDYRIVNAMHRIDEVQFRKDPELMQFLVEQFQEGVRRAIEREKRKDTLD